MSWDTITEQALPSREVTHLHVLRHGPVDTGGARRAYGHSDLPLSARGRAEGEALVRFAVERLPRPVGVLSSDLARCTEIAGPLAARLGVPLEATPELREQHMGAWEGRSWEELTAEDVAGVRAFWADYAGARPPGGESLADLSRRVGDWLARRMDAPGPALPPLRGRRWVLVGHAGVVRVLTCGLLGIPLDQALRFAPLPSTHSWFLLAQAGAVVQALGERPFAIDPGAAARARAGGRRSHGPPRLALSGSAGTGKTTLGRRLAEELGVPYIPEGMRARIEGGLSLHGLGLRRLRALVLELWAEQCAAEDAALASAGGFVADRSPVDFAAFWLTYRFTDDREATAAFFADVFARARRLDHVVLLPWGVLPLVPDGVRASNPWIQRHYQATLEGLLFRELRPPLLAVMPPLRELDARVAWVLDLLEQSDRAGGWRPGATA